MPYVARGNTVYKKTDKGLKVKKRHPNAAKAEAHASAMNIAIYAPEKVRDKKDNPGHGSSHSGGKRTSGY